MSLQRRRERYVILMMWKIFHKVIPNCCNIQYKTSSRNGCVAIVPPLAKSSSSSNQTLYDQSFAVLGPKLWNKVPSTVRAAPTFDSFKISLSNFLDLIPDNPPVTGYSCSWTNSLVDYTPIGRSDIWWPFRLNGWTSPSYQVKKHRGSSIDPCDTAIFIRDLLKKNILPNLI